MMTFSSSMKKKPKSKWIQSTIVVYGDVIDVFDVRLYSLM